MYPHIGFKLAEKQISAVRGESGPPIGKREDLAVKEAHILLSAQLNQYLELLSVLISLIRLNHELEHDIHHLQHRNLSEKRSYVKGNNSTSRR